MDAMSERHNYLCCYSIIQTKQLYELLQERKKGNHKDRVESILFSFGSDKIKIRIPQLCSFFLMKKKKQKQKSKIRF